MARKEKKILILPQVEIETLAAEGKALAHYEDRVVFVPFAAPGDVADLRVTKKKSSFYEATIERLVKPSIGRVAPVCSHFTVCGGCKWQHIPYEEQLKAKQQQVIDAMERIGHVVVEEYLPIVGAREPYRYRNKLEFTFSHKRWLLPEELKEPQESLSGLGFHIPKMFDKVLDINQCHLGSELADRIRLFIKDYTSSRAEQYPYFDLRKQEGLMRTLIIRTSSIGEVMVIVVFYQDAPEERIALLDALYREFPEITSLLYVINQKRNDTIQDQEVVCYRGLSYIHDEMEGLRFRINPKSFYQTNSRQAYELYRVARDFAQLKGDEVVYDLYTGCGTIANFVARSASKVVGIEYVPEAIEDAKLNSQINGIENTLFFAGDMKDVLSDSFIQEHGKPEIIITDPPRAGMHEDVVQTILRAAPKRIVYVSCNPATQARDLALLTATGAYRVVRSQAVDMFPQTHHIENVCLLEQV